MAENDLSRHYTELAKQTHGVNDGFYPLGSCTMKYNPKINEEIAALPGFTERASPAAGSTRSRAAWRCCVLAEKYLCEITGMDAMTFQPAAGAHGEFTGLLLIKAYHKARGDTGRTKIIVPDSAHGTNPATRRHVPASRWSTSPPAPDGCVDLDAAAGGGRAPTRPA